MKKYISYFKIQFSNNIQYRLAALGGISTQFFWGIMLILMFKAFYQSGEYQAPMNFNELVTYLWLQQAFLNLTFLYRMDGDILETIRKGDIAYELCRPINIYTLWFSKSIARRYANSALRCLPILFIAFILPEPFRMMWPDHILQCLLFFIALNLSAILVTSMCMLIYGVVFYTVSGDGIRRLYAIIVSFLSGDLIPLPFFPQKLAQLLYLSPFAGIADTPFRIYNGSIALNEAVLRIGLQLFWISTFILAGNMLLYHAQKRVVSQGG